MCRKVDCTLIATLDIFVLRKMHALKRRKLELEQAGSSLAKPFHSPLRADASQVPTDSIIEDENSKIQVACNDSQGSEPMPVVDQTHNRRAVSQVTPSPSLKVHDAAPAAHPGALQREYATLGRQLTSLRQSLDTAQQALKIRTNKQDVQTQALIAKWKAVVREAAEDLFEAAKESFKSQNTDDRQPQDWESTAWQQDERYELTQDQREMLEVHEAEARAQAQRYGLLEAPNSNDDGNNVSAL